MCVFVRDCLLSDKFQEDRNHRVCDVLAVFLYVTLLLCYLASKKKPCKQESLSTSGRRQHESLDTSDYTY